MKTSTALKRTKDKLWDGIMWKGNKTHLICLASDAAEVSGKVRPIVRRLLYPYITLSQWLHKEKNIVDPWTNPSKLQATRHAWLDHLIAHYESLGD